MTKYGWSHFIALLAPSMVAVTYWNLDAGAYEEREPGNSENTMGPRPILGYRRVWPVQAYQGSEDTLRPLRSEARPGHAT